MLKKSMDFMVKDLDRGNRTAVIAFATYNNLDRDEDIMRKGVFNKSWQENRKDIRFFLNHDKNLVPGRPLDFFEDETHAYAKAYLGTHTLGEDVLKMMDEGIITDSSFGFIPVPDKYAKIPGKKGREFKEVKLFEFSVLTHWGANPMSGVKNVSKDYNPTELLERIETLEKFVRNTTASDETIKSVINQIEEIKSFMTEVDTASTHVASEPQASEKDNVDAIIQLLTFKHFS